MKKKTHNQFLQEMKEKHPNIDVLDLYKNGRTKIKLKCKVCNNEFSATPGSLYMGHGCPKCAGYFHKTTEQFLKEMSIVNPNIIIDGSYINSKTKIDVHCNICNYKWKSTPNSLLRKRGCSKCSKYLKKTNEQFILEMKNIHPDIEVLEKYTNNHTRIKCHCKICGNDFDQTPHALIDAKSGCTFCSKSNTKGEIAVRNWLMNNNMIFIKQKSFKGCKNKQSLLFDFYLPKYNMAIEYDGKQHFEPIKHYGGDIAFAELKKRDEIKNEYCKANNITLLRIPYWEYDNISKILETNII